MKLDIRSLWAQIPTVHLRIVVVVFLGVGITNLILGSLWAVSALVFVIIGGSQKNGFSFFSGLLMTVLSIPLVLMSLLYVLCGAGILRRKKVARYGSMVLCLWLARFTLAIPYFSSVRFPTEPFIAIIVLSLYLLGALIWGWEPRDTSDASLLKLGP